MIYLDTHVAVWLHAGRTDLVPGAATGLIDRREPLVSPVVGLELQLLHESGKIREGAEAFLASLEREVGLRTCALPFTEVVGAALAESWTRDPFDRLIVAQARLREAPLLTKDREIHLHYERAVWE